MRALVTGASSGIGLPLAKKLAGRGYDLVVFSVEEQLIQVAEQLRATGIEITEVREDLATRKRVNSLWTQTKALSRLIDIACINAGIGVGGIFSDQSRCRTEHGEP